MTSAIAMDVWEMGTQKMRCCHIMGSYRDDPTDVTL